MPRGHFLPLGGQKTQKKHYSGDPKIISFSVFRPPEAENDLLGEYTKKFFSKSVFFVFSERESFLASGGHKTGKTLFYRPKNPLFGLENSLFCHFPASRGQKWNFGKNTKKSLQNFLCFLNGSHFWFLEGTKCEKPYSVDLKMFCLDLKIVSFAIFWPQEAENDILASYTKKWSSG